MIRLMVLETIYILMDLLMKENGKKINSMGLGKKFGQMVLSLKETIQKGKSKAQVLFYGLMAAITLESFMITISMALEFINGQMEEYLKGLGKTTRCMEVDYLLGLMVESMKELTQMTKKKVMVYLDGPMADSMQELGKEENNTVKGSIFLQMELKEKECGLKEKEQLGQKIELLSYSHH